jgi:hypothetical protein
MLVIRWDLMQVQCDMYHIGQCSVYTYIDCKNIHFTNNKKNMYQLNGSSKCESYSRVHICQLIYLLTYLLTYVLHAAESYS